MNHLHHNMRPFGSVRPVIAFALLATATSILLVAVLAAAARFGSEAIGRFVPGWPWW